MCLILCILYSIKSYIYIETDSICLNVPFKTTCFALFLLKPLEGSTDKVIEIKLWSKKLMENDPIVSEAMLGQGTFGIEI